MWICWRMHDFIRKWVNWMNVPGFCVHTTSDSSVRGSCEVRGSPRADSGLYSLSAHSVGTSELRTDHQEWPLFQEQNFLEQKQQIYFYR